MKLTILILGWIMVVGMLTMAYMFVSQYKVSESDFISQKGTVSGEPIISKDEYGVDTALRLRLENDSTVYSLPGKLLRIAHPDIYQLADGNQVELVFKKADVKNRIEKFMSPLERVWSIGLVDEVPFVSLVQSMKHAKDKRSLVYAGLFMLFAVVIATYLLKIYVKK